ncbi:MsnO8 family LLM class oxidoreductase [Pseudokineococcus basanitobsidens]|uniref:MsnO8 family LLM class oxidoreductase n=1 Tax=Pseudokineococcus basanitobsidens TaxID=1926649 RepID=A0ABU8RP03_9ACTN
MLDVPISLLDRARTRVGEPDARALTGVLERARDAERLGLHRLWVAEHHAVPGLAGSAPAVLAAAVLGVTSRLRVGTAGVMLPHHAPLVVAEQLATVAALHPGRVDVGVGRSPGFTAPVRRALRRGPAEPATAEDPAAADDTFAADVAELRDHLAGRAAVTSRPQVGPLPLLVLATGGGLRVAARLGLPVVVGGPLVAALLGEDAGAAARAREALADYRRSFRPAEDAGAVDRPAVLLAVDVLLADDEREAADLALPEAWARAEARSTGSFPPLRPVAELRRRTATGAVRRHLDHALAAVVTGTPDDVAGRLQRVVGTAGAAELVATSSTADRRALARSDTLLAALARRGPDRSPPR